MKGKIKKIIKWLVIVSFSTYLLILIGSFLWLVSYGFYPKDALIVINDLFIKGPINRVLFPVSSDKKMIAYFQQNRQDFERITEIVRDQCVTPNKELETLTKKIKAIQIESGVPIGGNWLPDPYSIESINKNFKTPQDKCKYSSVGFFLEKYSFRDFWKGIVYLPEAPIINEGILKYPGITPRYLQKVKYVMPRGQVLINLDNTVGFLTQEQPCRFKQIESRWFLFVCPNSYTYYYMH